MNIVAEHDRQDAFTVVWGSDEQGFFVQMWNPDDELHWEVRGVVIEDDGKRQKRRAFTHAEALTEYEKWLD